MEPNPVNNLFNSIDDTKLSSVVSKGSIVGFRYVGQTRHQIHDPYPLIIVSDIFQNMIRGVNLHYLTYPYVQSLVSQYAVNNRFSYAYIKGDSYIVGAFRSYKRNGITQLRIIDSNFLRSVLKSVRALDIGEIDKMRDQIRQMIQDNQPNQPVAQPGPEIK